MYIDFSGLFHQSSKDRTGQGTVRIPLDNTLWPQEWTSVVYKEYPRMEKATLPQPREEDGVFTTIRERRSVRNFSGKPIALPDLSALLRYSCGMTNRADGSSRRVQPSGGGRYPIETYLLMFRGSDELAPGVYHYNVRQHALDVLWKRDFTKEDIAGLFTYPWAQDTSCAVVLTAVFERNHMKYGERGYRHILIEAGAILQNLYLSATHLDIACCAIDGVRESAIETLLDIDGYDESVICSAVLGTHESL